MITVESLTQGPFPEWAHQFIATRPCPQAGYGPTAKITVTAGLHKLGGNALPYFSVTAEIRRPRARDCDSCGCQHDHVLHYWPDLAPIVALHLSDSTGAPMHAGQNGWYQAAGYFGGAGERYHGGNGARQHWGSYDPTTGEREFLGYRESTREECLAVVADHVRLPVEEMRTILDGLYTEHHLPETVPPALRWVPLKRAFMAWAETQRPRWQAEAVAGVELLDRLIAQKRESAVS
jgi:hypothetical protein